MIARLISDLLGPLTLYPLLSFFLVRQSRLSSNQTMVILPILFIFHLLIPFIYVFYKKKSGTIGDWDISERTQRYKPLAVTVLSFAFSLFPLSVFGNTFIARLYLFIFFLLLLNSIITLFWKISFHMAMNVVFSLMVNFLFQWKYPMLYLTIPLIFWSRLRLKKHTVSQLLGALILNGALILLFLGFK